MTDTAEAARTLKNSRGLLLLASVEPALAVAR